MKNYDDFIIDQFTWSFSRINSYGSGCKKEWHEKYILCEPTEDSFDGQFGSFCHHILESYFKGEMGIWDLADYYEAHYHEAVTLPCPYPNGDTKYEKGLEYFQNFSFDHDKYEVLGVEKPVRFDIKNEFFCVGYIDLLLREKSSGMIILCDHKSSTIKKLKNGNISKSDQEHWKAFQRQQLLYSAAVLEEYGRVDKLMWNMFKDGTFLEMDWSEAAMNEALDWAYDTIVSIKNTPEYPPTPSWYYCCNLCGRRNNYCPYKRLGLIYEGIYSKCYNPKAKGYFEYGGLGIGMAEEWKDDNQKFFKWALDNSGYGDGLILKRYNEEGDFTPDNCYWDERPIEEEYYGE